MEPMNWLKFAIIAYITVILQTAFVPVVLPDALRPNLMIVLVVYYLLTCADEHVLIAALILGLLADLTSIMPLGTLTVGFGLAALLVRAAKPIMFTELPATHAFAAFVSHIILVLTCRVLDLVFPHTVCLPYTLGETLLQAAATALVAAAVCRLIIWRSKTSRLK